LVAAVAISRSPKVVPAFRHSVLPAAALARSELAADAVVAVTVQVTFGSAAMPTIAPDGGGSLAVVVVAVVDVDAVEDEDEVVAVLEVGVDFVVDVGVDETVTVFVCVDPGVVTVLVGTVYVCVTQCDAVWLAPAIVGVRPPIPLTLIVRAGVVAVAVAHATFVPVVAPAAAHAIPTPRPAATIAAAKATQNFRMKVSPLSLEGCVPGTRTRAVRT
jgi:hypothetical protein